MKYSMFSIGDTFISKHYKITEKEILEFAHQFDPQYMHLDKKKQVKECIKDYSIRYAYPFSPLNFGLKKINMKKTS